MSDTTGLHISTGSSLGLRPRSRLIIRMAFFGATHLFLSQDLVDSSKLKGIFKMWGNHVQGYMVDESREKCLNLAMNEDSFINYLRKDQASTNRVWLGCLIICLLLCFLATFRLGTQSLQRSVSRCKMRLLE